MGSEVRDSGKYVWKHEVNPMWDSYVAEAEGRDSLRIYSYLDKPGVWFGSYRRVAGRSTYSIAVGDKAHNDAVRRKAAEDGRSVEVPEGWESLRSSDPEKMKQAVEYAYENKLKEL